MINTNIPCMKRMATFVNGVVGAGKSAALIRCAEKLRAMGHKVCVAMPALCNSTHVISRNGCKIKVDLQIDDKAEYYGLVLVDEAQFLTSKQAAKLVQYGDVMFFGLNTDFMGKEFSGSEFIRRNANGKTIKMKCAYCPDDAEYNLKLEDGKRVYEGEQIQLGAEFIGVCKQHFR